MGLPFLVGGNGLLFFIVYLTVDISWRLFEPYSDCQSLSRLFCRHPLCCFFWGTVSHMHLLVCLAWVDLPPLILELEIWGNWLERETCLDPLDFIPLSAKVMHYEGNRFVPVATKG